MESVVNKIDDLYERLAARRQRSVRRLAARRARHPRVSS
jgi:hypothetical protein